MNKELRRLFSGAYGKAPVIEWDIRGGTPPARGLAMRSPADWAGPCQDIDIGYDMRLRFHGHELPDPFRAYVWFGEAHLPHPERRLAEIRAALRAWPGVSGGAS